MSVSITTNPQEQQQAMQRYYRWQSAIYDATRWSFLYGRESVLNHIPFSKSASLQILEVGCGTGKNLVALAEKFPNATITGVDVSEDMIKASEQKTAIYGDRIQLRNMPYEAHPENIGKYDLVLFSYSLTMINPHWFELLKQAKTDLKKGGCVVVADFHDSPLNWFKKHMGNNHVRMDGHLLPVLEKMFLRHFVSVKSAYGFVWQYVQYVGRKE